MREVAKRGLCMTQTGTPYYASPEVWRDMPYDAGILVLEEVKAEAKSDMWSLGCILYASWIRISIPVYTFYTS